MSRTVLNEYALPIKVTASYTPYPGVALVCVVHANLNPARARVYIVDQAGIINTVGESSALGKDDSAAAIFLPNGTVRLFVSEADLVPNSSGATSKLVYYDFPNVLPPATPSLNIDVLARADIEKIKQWILSAENIL